MTEWIIDKSAYEKLSKSPDIPEWTSRMRRGLVRVITPTLLELGHSARNGLDWESRIANEPTNWLIVEDIEPDMERRALEVQRLLAMKGQHRAPSVVDLLVAAAAELHRLVVLHDDRDFDLIAGITGQKMERLRLLPMDDNG